MKRFKETTKGNIVIMGRNTWESLPENYRPLPDRINIVLTSNRDYNAPGAFVYTNLHNAIGNLKLSGTDIWIIGGESVYKEGMFYADVLYQTFVDKEIEGDAKAPVIDDNWKLKTTSPFIKYNELFYQFNTYIRKAS